MRLGVIADTHGLLRPEVFEVFREVDHILHAGDVGPPSLLTELEAIAPLGVKVDPPRASLYVWLPIPPSFSSSIDFTADLLEKTAVVVSPGSGFGDAGEGYVRVALCVEEERLREAGRRMAGAGYRY